MNGLARGVPATILAAAAVVTVLAFAGSPSRAATDYAKTYGAAWNPAIGAWLPDPDTGFDAWSKKQAIVIQGYDYFVCGSNAKPSVPKSDFSYAGNACAPLKSGTVFVYGTAEPIRGGIVYDRTHGIALYFKGCCAWRGFALSSNVGSPPKRVANADLSNVHTARGITLGMTPKQLVLIYGAAAPHATKGQASLTTLSYTTMRGGPNGGGDACGQWQSFTFKNGRLVTIELLSGC